MKIGSTKLGEPPILSRTRPRRHVVGLVSLALLASLAGEAFAQPGSSWSGVRPPGVAPASPTIPRTSPAAPSSRGTPAASSVSDTSLVARVGGRPITRQAYDRIAEPYFERLRAQYGASLTPEILRSARVNVLNELVKREVLSIEARRQGIVPSEAEVDSVLKLDPFFLTNGAFDPVKFNQFKLSPSSNYLQVLPQVRDAVAIEKLDRSVRRRLAPSTAAVRAEWTKRNDQVTFQYLPLLLREVSLDPESTEEDWAAHFRAHAQEYARKGQLRLRAFRVPLPPKGDSTRAAAEVGALARGRRLADSLAAGTLPDSAEGAIDTGLFPVPGPSVPVLGQVPGLSEELARADTVPSVRVVGPFVGNDAVFVGTIVERRPRHVPPMREVLGAVKQRADSEKRQALAEKERRAFYDSHPERFRGPSASVTRVTLTNGKHDALVKIAAGLASRRSPRDVARSHGAVAETHSFVADVPDSMFPKPFLDSLLASASGRKGVVEGPRRFGARWAVWRVDAADTAFLPPYDRIRVRVEREFAADRKLRDEREARVWFDANRGRYRIPVQRAIEYVSVTFPPADSVQIPETELRAAYEKNKARYVQKEEVKARHILITTGAGTTEARAKARAESLLTAARSGADFAELARRFSKEPAAGATGGDLGWFSRGQMVKEFEAAAFATKPGTLSPVVKSSFGYHVIRVEDRKPAGTRAFPEVREELRAQLAAARADTAAARAARSLGRKLALGGDAQALAAAHGGVRTSKPFVSSEPIPDLGVVPGLAEQLPRMTAGKWSARAFRTGRAYLLVRPLEERPARPAEFDEVKARAVEDSKNARREELLEKKVATLRAALAAGASLDSLAAPYGGLKSSGAISRSSLFVPGIGAEPRVVEKAFALAEGVPSDTLKTAQGRVWIRVESRKQNDPKNFTAARQAIAAELLQRNVDGWLQARKKTLKIEVLRRDLRDAAAETENMAGP